MGKISYADRSWNVFTGCLPGLPCWDRCWARRMAKRLAGRCGYDAKKPFKPTFHPKRLEEPLRWRKPQRVAVSFMGDIALASPGELYHVMDAIAECPQHRFLILTKRPKLFYEKLWTGMPRYFGDGQCHPNVWLGVSVTNQADADERIPLLLKCPAAVRWVSIEPMLGPVDLRLDSSGVPHNQSGYPLGSCGYYCNESVGHVDHNHNRLAWVVVGGESGPGARPLHPDWVRSVRDQCLEARVPFYMKQWGEWVPENRGSKGKPACGLYRDGRMLLTDDDFKREGEPWLRSLAKGDGDFCFVTRVGTKAAGNVLDGRQWQELPEAAK